MNELVAVIDSLLDAVACVCAGLGYGSGSESDDEADNTSPAGRETPAAESSDDEELQDRIQCKKMEFERKMQELEECENGEHSVSCVLSGCSTAFLFVKKILCNNM